MIDAKTKAGAHALLVDSSGKIALVQKSLNYTYDKNNAGKISMFGGGLEMNEDPLNALRRELREELGLDISGKTIHMLNTYHKTKEQDGCDEDVHVFLVKGVDFADLRIQLEGDDVVVKDANEKIIEGLAGELLMRSNLTRITRLVLEDFARGTN